MTFLKSDGHNSLKQSERSVLSEKMVQTVLLHFPGLGASALRDYTFERRKTDYAQAKADLDIYDGAGKLVFQGREFHSGIAGYWRPSRVSMTPEWASNEKAWGHASTASVLTA
jgi:hypothetical protein